MSWLIDTNVISETIKPAPNAAVAAWLATADQADLHVSVVTIAELRLGIEQLPSPQRVAVHASWLRQVVRPLFEDRVLAMEEEAALIWRRLFDSGKRSGRPFDPADLVIAATALAHDLTVVTCDVVHFEAAGALVFNPWQEG